MLMNLTIIYRTIVYWKCLETNGNDECSATFNPVYSMIIAAISYSNAKSS